MRLVVRRPVDLGRVDLGRVDLGRIVRSPADWGQLSEARCLGPFDPGRVDPGRAPNPLLIRCVAVLKRFVQHTRKTAFIVEHDFMMAAYLADRVIVYEGTPAVSATATAPQPLQSGMNLLLKRLDVTFRRDPETHRPRINKAGSSLDKEQKASGNYFYVDQ